jgi:aminoglycoside phosphotransferase (APT) family kinase protein
MTGTGDTASARLIAPLHPFATAALAGYLRDIGIPCDGDPRVRQFQGGQSNPTYRIDVGGRSLVLRRKPPGKLLPSAHAVEREYRVMKALAATDVPVAAMIALCEDERVLGTPFYLMEHVDGRVLWDPTLPGMPPAARAAHYDELNRVIAALHGVDVTAAGLGDFGRAGGYVERQIARWSKQYESGGAARIPSMDRVIDWLPQHLPGDDETSIVHGDFRLDNVIFHPTEPRVLAVLDWELSTLGHPLSDFAYHAMAWRLKAGDFRGLADCDFAALGIPTEAEYVAAYCRRTGRHGIADWRFYLIFNMFRITAILHGVHSRALQGNAASGDAMATGARAQRIADIAWSMAQRSDDGGR